LRNPGRGKIAARIAGFSRDEVNEMDSLLNNPDKDIHQRREDVIAWADKAKGLTDQQRRNITQEFATMERFMPNDKPAGQPDPTRTRQQRSVKGATVGQQSREVPNVPEHLTKDITIPGEAQVETTRQLDMEQLEKVAKRDLASGVVNGSLGNWNADEAIQGVLSNLRASGYEPTQEEQAQVEQMVRQLGQQIGAEDVETANEWFKQTSDVPENVGAAAQEGVIFRSIETPTEGEAQTVSYDLRDKDSLRNVAEQLANRLNAENFKKEDGSFDWVGLRSRLSDFSINSAQGDKTADHAIALMVGEKLQGNEMGSRWTTGGDEFSIDDVTVTQEELGTRTISENAPVLVNDPRTSQAGEMLTEARNINEIERGMRTLETRAQELQQEARSRAAVKANSGMQVLSPEELTGVNKRAMQYMQFAQSNPDVAARIFPESEAQTAAVMLEQGKAREAAAKSKVTEVRSDAQLKALLGDQYDELYQVREEMAAAFYNQTFEQLRAQGVENAAMEAQARTQALKARIAEMQLVASQEGVSADLMQPVLDFVGGAFNDWEKLPEEMKAYVTNMLEHVPTSFRITAAMKDRWLRDDTAEFETGRAQVEPTGEQSEAAAGLRGDYLGE